MRSRVGLFLILTCWYFGCNNNNSSIKVASINGITHIKNSSVPLAGHLFLEVEKKLEIDPYKYEEIAFAWFDFIRDNNGNIILYNSDKAEAHRFNEKGEYLGSFIKKGQGPGEFPDQSFFRLFFADNQILAAGAKKLVRFSMSGQFISEEKLDCNPVELIDKNRFIVEKKSIRIRDTWQKISLVEYSSKDREGLEIELFKKKNAGAFWGKNNKWFIDSWATPLVCFSYDRMRQSVFVGLNTEYSIYVKDLLGNTRYVIERSHSNFKLDRSKKNNILSQYLNRRGSSKWILKEYPNTLVAFTAIKTLPNNFLAIYRVSGPKQFEVDIFDHSGRYKYIAKLHDGILLEKAKFYKFGFATQIIRDEMPVYCEYRIKNLPEIFNN